MSQPRGTGRPVAHRTTRRTVLTGAAASLGGATLSASTASGQITINAVIPRPERWADQNLAGFMIHLGPTLDPEDVDTMPDCTFEGWPPEEIDVYDAALINRRQADTPEEEISLFVGADQDIGAGELFLINTFEECESDHFRLELEGIGRRFQGTASGPAAEPEGVDVEETTRSEAFGPGFGVVQALLAAAGLGGLSAWLRRDA